MSNMTLCACFMVFIIFLLAGCTNEDSRKPGAPQINANVQGPQRSGEELFRQFCFNCHPDGNNVSDPARSLHGSVLRKDHITTPDDIVKIMRNPISRMIRFDAATISDKDARTIAEYVLLTFK